MLEEKPDNNKRQQAMAGYTVGLSFASNIFVGVLFGLGIDHFFDTTPIFLLVFLVLGILAGFRVIWHHLVKSSK